MFYCGGNIRHEQRDEHLQVETVHFQQLFCALCQECFLKSPFRVTTQDAQRAIITVKCHLLLCSRSRCAFILAQKKDRVSLAMTIWGKKEDIQKVNIAAILTDATLWKVTISKSHTLPGFKAREME